MAKFVHFPNCILVFLVMFCESHLAFQTTMELSLQRVEQTIGPELIDASHLRVMKFNRTVAVLNGTLFISKDMDDQFEFRISVAYSRIGNNQFVEYPMKTAQEKVCNVLNGSYRDYQHLWADTTNFPQLTDEERYCPLPRGEYWIKNYAPVASWVPPMVPEGLWRMTLDILSADGEIMAQLRSYTWLRK
ncbi:AAEL004928-PA [Aedes aegypti]|nr:AAEL004928-PA [Aedes aegypti]